MRMRRSNVILGVVLVVILGVLVLKPRFLNSIEREGFEGQGVSWYMIVIPIVILLFGGIFMVYSTGRGSSKISPF
jgi:hypothetical protein